MNQSKTSQQEEIEKVEVEITNLDFGETFDILTLEPNEERIVIGNAINTGRALNKNKKENGKKSNKGPEVEVEDFTKE